MTSPTDRYSLFRTTGVRVMARAVFALTLLFLFTKCTNEGSGIVPVRNIEPLWGGEPELALEFVDSLTVDSVGITDFTIDKNGALYYLTYKGFSDYTVFRRSSGGEAPAEFIDFGSQEDIESMNRVIRRKIGIDADGRLHVFTIQKPELNLCVEVYGRDGIFETRTQFDFDHFYLNPTGSNISSSGELIVQPGKFVLPLTLLQTPHLAAVYDSEGKLRRKFGFVHEFGLSQYTLDGNTALFASDEAGNVYAAFRHLNRIEKYSPGGQLLFRADRPLNYAVTEHVKKQTGSRMDLLSSVRSNERLTDVSAVIGIDSEGRLWVPTFTRQDSTGSTMGFIYCGPENGELQVFTPEGQLLGAVSLPVKFFTMKVFGDRVFFQNSDFKAITEFRIVGR
ncbi:hypothetical protein ACFL6I_18860 [candidate division KSB1 bacterium]